MYCLYGMEVCIHQNIIIRVIKQNTVLYHNGIGNPSEA